MADTNYTFKDASGTTKTVDARSEATNQELRAVVVIGDPSTNAGVAPVDATKGLAVDLTATGSNANAIKVDNSAVTQPVSAASLPLPTGAATAAKQPALGIAGTPSADVISVQGVTSMTALKVDGSGVTQPVSGTFWQATQPVSASSLPLPTGASTAAKQPALGTAGTASADVITVQGITSMTPLKVDGSGVTQPVSISGNQAVNIAQMNGVATTMGNGVSGTGVQRVTIASDSTGTVAATQSGTWTVQPGNTANTTAWLTSNRPATSGGYSIYRLLAAASTNGNNIKGSAGQIFGWYLTNTSAAMKYVKFYNKATAPTVGTDTPVITIGIPATSAANVEFMNGIAFGTGIGIGITGAVADNDTTALTANDVVVNIFYV